MNHGNCFKFHNNIVPVNSTFSPISLIDAIMNSAKEYNVTYHPFLDHYLNYKDVSKTPFDIVGKMSKFGQEIDQGRFITVQTLSIELLEYDSFSAFLNSTCIGLSPCADITYEVGKETIVHPDLLPHNVASEEKVGECNEGDGEIILQFGQNVEYETEEEIIKSVDLLSGIGGALGLWLGWSFLTLGEFVTSLAERIMERMRK